jgi:hypothetical protein
MDGAHGTGRDASPHSQKLCPVKPCQVVRGSARPPATVFTSRSGQRWIRETIVSMINAWSSERGSVVANADHR